MWEFISRDHFCELLDSVSMEEYAIFKSQRTFDDKNRYQVNTFRKEIVSNYEDAVYKVNAYNAHPFGPNVYYMQEGEKGENWDNNTERPIIHGKYFKNLHPNIPPLIYFIHEDKEFRDIKDNIDITDLTFFFYKESRENASVTISHELIVSIADSLISHRNGIEAIIGNHF